MSSLASALIDAGIDPADVNMNHVGEWQRVPTTDKPRRRNGSVKVYAGGSVAIQNWATDERWYWRPDKPHTKVPCSG